MASAISRRAALVEAITKLKDLHLRALSRATYPGWTPEDEAEDKASTQRIAFLQRELDAIDREESAGGNGR